MHGVDINSLNAATTMFPNDQFVIRRQEADINPDGALNLKASLLVITAKLPVPSLDANAGLGGGDYFIVSQAGVNRKVLLSDLKAFINA
jgi:hypothetical protein